MMKNNNLKLYLLGIILLLGSSFILDNSALIVFLALGLIFVSINEFKIPSHIYLIGGIISEIVFFAAILLKEFPETVDIFLRGTLVVGISAIYAIITSFKSLKNKNKRIKNIITLILSILLLIVVLFFGMIVDGISMYECMY